MSTSLDILDMNTIDLTFNKEIGRKKSSKKQNLKNIKIPEPKDLGASRKRLNPKIKDIELTGSELTSKKRGLNILGHYEPNKKQLGGLEFGIVSSGSTMPFTGKGRVFYWQ